MGPPSFAPSRRIKSIYLRDNIGKGPKENIQKPEGRSPGVVQGAIAKHRPPDKIDS